MRWAYEPVSLFDFRLLGIEQYSDEDLHRESFDVWRLRCNYCPQKIAQLASWDITIPDLEIRVRVCSSASYTADGTCVLRVCWCCCVQHCPPALLAHDGAPIMSCSPSTAPLQLVATSTSAVDLLQTELQKIMPSIYHFASCLSGAANLRQSGFPNGWLEKHIFVFRNWTQSTQRDISPKLVTTKTGLIN